MGGAPRPVDRGSPVPVYFQIATRIREMIDAGELPEGGRLPAEAALAARLGATTPSLRRAVSYLVEQGVLARKRGAGTRVLPARVRRPLDLTSLHDDLAREGRAPATRLRSFGVGQVDDDVAAALGVPAGTAAARFERLRLAGGEPLALMTNVVPTDVLALRPDDLAVHGLYELLRAGGHAPRLARQVVGARAATASEADALGEVTGAPLLTVTRTAWDAAGQAVEFGSHVYRPSRYAVESTLAADPAAPHPAI